MPKKPEITENQDNNPDQNEIDKADSRIEAATTDRVEKAVKKGVKKGEAVNIIGDITPPEDPTDKKEVKAYFKEISEKLDQLLKSKSPEVEEDDEEETPPKPEPKLAWYDRPIL